MKSKDYHQYDEEYAFNCTNCDSILFLSFASPVDSDTIFGDCTECGAEEVELEKASLSQVDDADRFKSDLRKFVAEQSDGVTADEVSGAMEEIVEEINSGTF